jgi:hypothetical protein
LRKVTLSFLHSKLKLTPLPEPILCLTFCVPMIFYLLFLIFYWRSIIVIIISLCSDRRVLRSSLATLFVTLTTWLSMATVVCCGRDIECSCKDLFQRQKENVRNVALNGVIDLAHHGMVNLEKRFRLF